MADAAAARREARRRKILENSHNRLQIISGVSSDECHKAYPIRTVIPEPECTASASSYTSEPDSAATVSSYSSIPLQNGIPFNQPELFQFLLPSHDIDASGGGEAASDLAPLLSPTEVPTLSLWEKITSYKIDIVLISLFIQILFGMSLINFDTGHFFLPIIVYIITKLIWFPTQNNSNISNMLMLLNVIAPMRMQRILYWTQCFTVFFQNIFLYLFTTICIQSLWISLKESLVT